MTYQCSTVLKKLRQLTASTEEEIFFMGDATFFCTFDENNRYDYSKFQKEIVSIIDQLVKDGYLKYGRNQYSFFITYKGLHPYLIAWNDLKRFLFCSILVPIIVSFITTLLTLLLQWLLIKP